MEFIISHFVRTGVLQCGSDLRLDCRGYVSTGVLYCGSDLFLGSCWYALTSLVSWFRLTT